MMNPKQILYKKILFLIILLIAFFNTSLANAQSKDTVYVNEHNIHTKKLKEGTSDYLVYYNMKGQPNKTNFEYWSRSISFEKIEDKNTIKIDQSWENKDSIFHKSSTLLNKENFKTLKHDTWWKKNNKSLTANFDFETKEAFIDGISLNKSADSTTNSKFLAFQKATNQNFLNWHLDLEVFQLLKFQKKTVYKINFYDPGFQEPVNVLYEIIGKETIKGYNNQKINCWLLYHEEPGSFKETFWISTVTNEVLKLEQEFGGNYRYKIKLGFN